jgi:hypothetical protein
MAGTIMNNNSTAIAATMEAHVEDIPANRIEHYWPLVYPMLKQAVNYSDGRWTEADLKADLKSGRQQLWIGFKGKPVGAATTQLIGYPQRRTLFIQFLGGEDFSQWGHEGIAALEAYGRQYKCDAIECFGRKGFLKVLGDYGFEPTYNVFEKKL